MKNSPPFPFSPFEGEKLAAGRMRGRTCVKAIKTKKCRLSKFPSPNAVKDFSTMENAVFRSRSRETSEAFHGKC
ncbi:MAG TPA: hypothetical protein PLR25_21940, partial [Planctomycetaceae bacterium]|nr:hypothetical protein [Planctomycetaceae bacterium]